MPTRLRRVGRRERLGRVVAGCALAALGGAPAAAAQDRPPDERPAEVPADEVSARDTIVLPALRAEVRRSLFDPGLARSVETLRPDDALVPYGDLADWLDARTGAGVRAYGGGGRQVLSIRGGRPEGVLVLLDGLPLNDPLTGAADLSTVALSSLESATLVRGAGSARYGSGALGGTLLLRSEGPGEAAPDGRIEVGSYGRYELSAAAGWSGTAASLRVGAGAMSAENDFSYRDRLDPERPEVRRANADASSSWLDLSGRIGSGRIALRHDRLERGVPGRMGTAAFVGDRWRESRWSLTGGVGTSGAEVTGGVRGLWMRYAPGGGDASEQRAIDARVAAEAAVPGGTGLVVGGRASLEDLDGTGIASSATRLTAGLTVRRPFGDAAAGDGFGLEPALALDVTDGTAVVSPELGAWFRPDPDTKLYARAGRGFRAPTFADLHFAAAPGLRANPDLEPEVVALDTELGAEVSRALGGTTASLRAAAWRRDTRQPIAWLASSVAVWSPRNLDRLLAYGLDVEAGVAGAGIAGGAWSVDTGLTLQRSRVGYGTNRNPLPYQPDVAVRIALGWQRGRTAARLQAAWNGDRTTSVAATRRLPGFLVVDAVVRHRVAAGPVAIDTSIGIDNLFDTSYELVELFPEPGRTLRLTLDVH